jgi:hypothetical protein
MSDKMALQIAIDLFHVPSQVRFVRAAPLPDGTPILLRIAAGDEEAEITAATLINRPRDIIRQAATFFIEQILLAPHTDSYRVLGASPQASAAELRRNLALLSKWLHPDRNAHNDRSVFIDRVTGAWNDVKTPERRATYDQLQREAMNNSKSRNGARNNHPWIYGNSKSVARINYRASLVQSSRRSHSGRKVGLLGFVLSALFSRQR